MNEENKTVDEAVEETPKSGTTTTNKKDKGGKNPIMWLLILVIVLAAAFFALDKMGLFGDSMRDTTDGEESADAAAVVATVNGITISRGELNEKIEQVRQSLPEGTPDPTADAAFELQLLDDLINLTLLSSIAEERNYTVSDDEVAAEKTALIEQFGDEAALQAQLDVLGLTMEELEENMREELRIRQLLEDETNIDEITVTDEEIQTAYDNAVGDAEGAPPLETVEELIRAELINQKSAEMVQQYLEEIRAEAEIEKTL